MMSLLRAVRFVAWQLPLGRDRLALVRGLSKSFSLIHGSPPLLQPPSEVAKGLAPHLSDTSLRQMIETFPSVSCPGLAPLMAFSDRNNGGHLADECCGSGLWEKNLCECVFLFTGKFFCKPHFIHCKTNTQQRKRRAELKQQREVRLVSKGLGKQKAPR